MKVSWDLEMSRSLDLTDLSLFYTVAKESQKMQLPRENEALSSCQRKLCGKYEKDRLYKTWFLDNIIQFFCPGSCPGGSSGAGPSPWAILDGAVWTWTWASQAT